MYAFSTTPRYKIAVFDDLLKIFWNRWFVYIYADRMVLIPIVDEISWVVPTRKELIRKYENVR